MAAIKILNGSFPSQTAYIISNDLVLRTASRAKRTYPIKSTIKSFRKISESKNKVLFEMTLVDDSTIKGETSKNTAYLLAKFEGTNLSKASITEIDGKKAVKEEKAIMVIFAAIAVFVLYLFATHEPSAKSDTRPETSVERNQIEAASYCKRLIENSLKAPSTAKFPWLVKATLVGNGVYTLSSYVDAQNSFGAQIRTNYSCRVKYNGGDYDGWIVEDLTINNNEG